MTTSTRSTPTQRRRREHDQGRAYDNTNIYTKCGGNAAQLMPGAVNSTWPEYQIDYSDDGRHLALVSGRAQQGQTGKYDLYVFDLGATTPGILVYHRGNDTNYGEFQPEWKPRPPS